MRSDRLRLPGDTVSAFTVMDTVQNLFITLALIFIVSILIDNAKKDRKK